MPPGGKGAGRLPFASKTPIRVVRAALARGTSFGRDLVGVIIRASGGVGPKSFSLCRHPPGLGPFGEIGPCFLLQKRDFGSPWAVMGGPGPIFIGDKG